MSNTAAEPQRYALIGHPIGHSWSPFIHGLFAKQTGRNLTYKLVDAAPERFRTAALEFFTAGGRGLNVTVPHKSAAAELVNRLTPRAERARAVNTIHMDNSAELLGDNTDGAGLMMDLKINLKVDLEGMRCLVLGAGGATRGVIAPLAEAGAAEIIIANRTWQRAVELAGEFSDVAPVKGCGFDDIPGGVFNLILNATSASLQGEVPPIPNSAIDNKTFCYDMSYGKGDTRFTQWAREHDAGRAVKGWGMLVEQAAESFKLWHGVRPDTKPVLQALVAL